MPRNKTKRLNSEGKISEEILSSDEYYWTTKDNLSLAYIIEKNYTYPNGSVEYWNETNYNQVPVRVTWTNVLAEGNRFMIDELARENQMLRDMLCIEDKYKESEFCQ